MNVTCVCYLKYLRKRQEISNTAAYSGCLFYRHVLSKCYALYSVTEEM